MIKGLTLGASIVCLCVGLCYGSYKLGYNDGENNVITTCSYYRKYALGGSQELLCSGVVNNEEMLARVLQNAEQPKGKSVQKRRQ